DHRATPFQSLDDEGMVAAAWPRAHSPLIESGRANAPGCACRSSSQRFLHMGHDLGTGGGSIHDSRAPRLAGVPVDEAPYDVQLQPLQDNVFTEAIWSLRLHA